MGTEAVWIPLVMAAVGTAATAYNAHQTAKRQDNELASQLRAQADKQRQADAKTSELIQQQARSTDADEKSSALKAFTTQLAAHKAQATNPLNVAGNMSDAYAKAGSNAALGITGSGSALADLTASIDAPRQQRANDAQLVDRYNTDIDRIRRFSAGDDFLHQLRLRGIKPNPWVAAAGGLASGAASAYGGSGGASDYSGWDMSQSPASTASGQWAYNLGRG